MKIYSKFIKLFLISSLGILLVVGCGEDSKDINTTVQGTNEVPIANAGENKSVLINNSIKVVGTGTDSDGTIIDYEWTKDDEVLATTASFSYLPTEIGLDTLTLTVTDDDGNSHSDTMVVTVNIDDNTNIGNGLRYEDFGITTLRYDHNSDWDATVQEIFGTEYRVADWNDLKDYHNQGKDLLSLYDGLGLTTYGASAYITRNGDSSYSSSRYYYASRHNHNKRSGYLAHENIDNYLISLGSWHGSRKIMVIKKSIGSVNNSPTVNAGEVVRNDNLSKVIGQWEGTYTCGQGLTGLTLDITQTSENPNNVKAIFNFYAVNANPSVPSGNYNMTGNYNNDSSLKLEILSWINRPNGYKMVGLIGNFNTDFTSYIGTVSASNCTTFSLTKK